MWGYKPTYYRQVTMNIEIQVSPYIQKYLEAKNPSGLKLKRKNIYAMIFFAQYKYVRAGKRKVKKVHSPFQNALTAKINIEVSEDDFVRQRMKKEVKLEHCVGFHSAMREFFYQDFFEYVNLRLLDTILRSKQSQIKGLIKQFMEANSLTEEEIKLETLIRNYGRYRANKTIDIYELISQLEDE